MELTIKLPANQAKVLLGLVESGALHAYAVVGAEIIDRSKLAMSVRPSGQDTEGRTPKATIDFPQLFRQNIIRSAEHVLERLEAADASTLTPAERDVALHVLTYGLKYPDAWPLASKALLALAPRMEKEGHRDEWNPYIEEGIQQSRQLQDKHTEATLHLQLGVLHQLRGKFDAARDEFSLSATEYASLGNTVDQAKALNRLAYIARLQRRYDDAKQLVGEALARLTENDPERAYSYFVQGTIAYDQPAWEQAAEFFQKALALWEGENNKRMVGWSLLNLGVAMFTLKRYPEAITYYEKAITLLGEINDPVYQAVTEMNLGNVYLLQRKPQQALDLYTKAESVFRNVMDELHLAMIYTNMGIAYRYLKNWTWAKLALLESIEGWQQLGNIESLVNAIEELGLLYLDQGMYARATTKFHDALNWLARIKNEPGYAPLLESVTRHLTEAQKKISPADNNFDLLKKLGFSEQLNFSAHQHQESRMFYTQ